MNIFTRILTFFGLKTRALSYNDYKELGWISDYGLLNSSGEVVTSSTGSRIATAFACMNALCQDISRLDWNVLRVNPDGKEIERGVLQKLLNLRPNSYTSAINFKYNLIWQMLSEGNGYAIIIRDSNFQPLEMHCLNSHEVSPMQIDNEIYYQYKGEFIPQRDVYHIKMYSFDGIKGVSPIIHNSQAFGLRLKQEKYKAQVLGQRPEGLLTFDQQLTPEQEKMSRDSWQKMTQGNNIGKTPVLSGGARYQAFMFDANQSQLIESGRMSDKDIRGIFRVPPAVIMDTEGNTYNNDEQQNRSYLKFSLMPIIEVMEQEADYKLLPSNNFRSKRPLETRMDTKEYMRGDMEAYTNHLMELRDKGIASANEIRSWLDLGKVDDENGDMVVIQGAYVPLDQLRDFYSGKTADPNQQSKE